MPTATRIVTMILFAGVALVTPTAADNIAGQSGTSLRPSTLTADELAKLLDVQIWKFEVSLPAEANYFEVGLELSENGQLAHPGGFGTTVEGPLSATSKREVLVAIIPVGGTLGEAEKVHVVVSAFGFGSGGTQDNPLKSLGLGRPGSPEDNKDGSFNLIGGYTNNRHVSLPLSTADKFIALKIKTWHKK